MNAEIYPALYRAADCASVEAQRQYLGIVRTYSYLLVAGAGLSVYGISSREAAACAALLFLASIFLSILMVVRNHEGTWYRARAIAESAKTSTWRFIMRAEPYNDSPSVVEVKKHLRNMLSNILKEHKDLAHELGGEIAGGEQITQEMCDIRAKPLTERINFYRSERVDEQRRWYAVRSGQNARSSSRWFAALIGFQAAALIHIILRIVFTNWTFWPTEVFVVAASGALTWIQVKRFREISASYGLAAHEIGILRGDLEVVRSEDQFGEFVRDAENAFSREHTQWVARKTN